MVSSPKPPPAPDPVQVTQAQQAASEEAARTQAALNRIDEVTPFGSVRYEELGPDQFRRITEMDPASQRQFEQQRALAEALTGFAGDQLGRVSGVMAQPWSFEGMPDAPVANEAVRQQTIDALMHRMDPMFDRDRQRLETQLANQGFARGSQAWDRATDELNRSMTDARMQATLGAGDEMSRLFGLEGATRDRAIQEAAFERGLPLNEIATLLGTSPGIQIPQFGSVPQVGVAPADAAGAHMLPFQRDMMHWQAKTQGQQGMMGNLFGLGGSILGAANPLGGFFGG